ncbi:11998_t:CDS:2 [Ambispora gerdemannii]|uniref:11998_t:CDS:1 n=1 Tax=Ambispora gerdemannii TaxID=144530 RepID=A0A9N9E6M1_9GLOM|nr:11998_t:CDS:2 [Ambispora gerdemannii]
MGTITYPTGDVLLRLVKLKGPSTTSNTTTTDGVDNTCVESRMRFRLISAKNSSVIPIEFLYEIDDINFCSHWIRLFPLDGESFMVSYFTPFNDSASSKTVYQENALVVDWFSRFIAEIRFGNVTVNDISELRSGFGAVNINPDNGFIWSNFYGGADSTNGSNNTSPQQRSWHAKVYFLIPNQNMLRESGEFTVYNHEQPATNMTPVDCTLKSEENENSIFTCVLKITDENSTSYKLISFKQQQQQPSISNLSLNIDTNELSVSNVKPLSTGDVFVAATYKNNNSITGQIYKNGAFNSTWDYNQVKYDHPLISGVFQNNSAYLLVSAGNDTSVPTPSNFTVVKDWNLVTINFKGLSGGEGESTEGNVQKTIPVNNSTIQLRFKEISIKFKYPVALSTGNLTIYQVPDKLRETYPANSAKLTNSNYTVTMSVLDSTFNRPNQKYSIKVDENFVRSASFNSSMMGISDWTVYTVNSSDDSSSESTDCIIRLTVDGTNTFKSLSSNYHKSFLVSLTKALEPIVPIPSDRLYAPGKFQYADHKNLLIAVTIEHCERVKRVKRD